jgi:hypothetical protein
MDEDDSLSVICPECDGMGVEMIRTDGEYTFRCPFCKRMETGPSLKEARTRFLGNE